MLPCPSAAVIHRRPSVLVVAIVVVVLQWPSERGLSGPEGSKQKHQQQQDGTYPTGRIWGECAGEKGKLCVRFEELRKHKE